MNSKTLSIYATIMAVVLVTGVASVSASPVYASSGGGDEVKLKNKMVNEDCEETLCVNAALNFANHDIIVVIP